MEVVTTSRSCFDSLLGSDGIAILFLFLFNGHTDPPPSFSQGREGIGRGLVCSVSGLVKAYIPTVRFGVGLVLEARVPRRILSGKTKGKKEKGVCESRKLSCRQHSYSGTSTVQTDRLIPLHYVSVPLRYIMVRCSSFERQKLGCFFTRVEGFLDFGSSNGACFTNHKMPASSGSGWGGHDG